MSWAARRQTTRLEDQAYSLLGIFNVQMPLLYGEGQRAFVRLQEEILKYTDDDSLLAWDIPDWRAHMDLQKESRKTMSYDCYPGVDASSYTFERIKYRCDEILAPSPACFKSSRKLIRGARSRTEPWFMSNLGLNITMELISTVWRGCSFGKSYFYVILDCRDEDDSDQRLALRGVSGGKGDSAMCLYLWDRIYEPRVSRLSQRQLDNDKHSRTYESIILLRQHESSFGAISNVVIVTMDTILNDQTRTDHVISIEGYYPCHAWNLETKKLSVSYYDHDNWIAAVRLTFKGDDLLLVLQSICWSLFVDYTCDIIPPILIHYPHGASGLRSVVSQIPKLLQDRRATYHGPLQFQYMTRKDEKTRCELLLKAFLSERRTATEGSESEPYECTSVAFGGALYVPRPHSNFDLRQNTHQNSQRKHRFLGSSKYFSK